MVFQLSLEAKLELNLNKSYQSTTDYSEIQISSVSALSFSWDVGKSLKNFKRQMREEGTKFHLLHLLTKKISSFGSGEASRLTPGFIKVCSFCLRKQKAGCLLPSALLSKKRIMLSHSESPFTSYPADSRALTEMLMPPQSNQQDFKQII